MFCFVCFGYFLTFYRFQAIPSDLSGVNTNIKGCLDGHSINISDNGSAFLFELFAQDVVRVKNDSTGRLLKHRPTICLHYQTGDILDSVLKKAKKKKPRYGGCYQAIIFQLRESLDNPSAKSTTFY